MDYYLSAMGITITAIIHDVIDWKPYRGHWSFVTENQCSLLNLPRALVLSLLLAAEVDVQTVVLPVIWYVMS